MDCEHAHSPLRRARLAHLATMPRAELEQAIAAALDKLVAPPALNSQRPPGYLFHGGTIYTMSDEQPTADALLVEGDAITAMGPLQEMRRQAPAGTQEVDLKLATLMPGFVDPHMHLVASAAELTMLDLTPPERWQDYTWDYVREKLLAAVNAAPSLDTPIMGQGFDPSQLRDATGNQAWVNLTVDVFDEILGSSDPESQNPIIIQSGSGHITYANRRALALAGIPATQPPAFPGGKVATYYGPPQDGETTGIFVEMAAQKIINAATRNLPGPPPMTLEDLVQKVGELFQIAVQAGNTMINDAATGIVAGVAVERLIIDAVLERLDHPIRVASALFLPEWDVPSAWNEINTSTPDLGNPLFLKQAVKLFADGSNQGATGLQRDQYSPWTLDRTRHAYVGDDIKGFMDQTPTALASLIGLANSRGWQVMIHANGDQAIDNAIAAYGAARDAGQLDPTLRNRIEHCSILHDEQIARMVELGLTPTFLIAHVGIWGEVLTRMLGDERASLLDRCASAYEAFGVFSLHSDYTVSPLTPLQRIQDAVTRIVRTTGQPLNPAECVPLGLALRAQTAFAAWHCRADHLVGSLAVGKKADLVVLGADPFAVNPRDIADIRILATWVNGRPVYEAVPPKDRGD